MNREIWIVEDSKYLKGKGLGGGQLMSIHLAKALSDFGFLVRFFDANAKLISRSFDVGAKNETFDSENVYIHPYRDLLNFGQQFFLAKSENILILSTTTKTHLIVGFVGFFIRFRHVPFVHLTENLVPRFFRGVLKTILKRSSFCLFPSSFCANSYGATVTRSAMILSPFPFGAKQEVLGGFVDTKILCGKEVRRDKLKLLFVGTLSKQKGIDVLCATVADLVFNEGLDFDLDVYGDGPLKTFLERKYETCAFLKFHGYQMNPFKSAANSDILILPSVIEESFGIVLLQASAAKLGIITTAIGSQASLIEKYNCGDLYHPEKVGELRCLLEKYHSSCGDLKNLKERSSALALEFTEEAFVTNVRRFFG